MESRAVVPQKENRGDMKQKNAVADVRNRRVLQDIGNLVKVPGVEGKKSVTEAVAAAKAVAVTKVVAAQRKVAEKPRPEDVIVISSDESTVKHRPRVPRDGNSRKNQRSLTSVLTARSKAAFEEAKKPVLDIDGADVNNELAVVEYVEDIYQYYEFSQEEGRVYDYMLLQSDITPKMRSILVDWLIEVHRKFQLMPETLYLTINIVDRFLWLKANVPRKELQLAGIGAMLIACKYEEIWAPEVNDFVMISDNAYEREQVLAMEKSILQTLEWYLTVPTIYVFLVRYTKACNSPSDEEMEDMVHFFSELSLMQYPLITRYSPSMIAASAVYVARCTLEKGPFWTETLKHHTGYSENQLMDCAKVLVRVHSTAAENKLKAVYKKFSSSDHNSVALISPAKSLVLSDASVNRITY